MRRIFNRHTFSIFICTSLLALTVAACGGDDDDEEEEKETVYGTLVLSESTTEDDGSFKLTKVSTCTLNAESDFLKVVLTGNQSKLIVKVQDAGEGEYACTKEDDGFDNCLVYAEVPSEAGSSKSNGYSMATDTDAGTTDSSFAYAGTCKVTLTDVSPSIEGSISCTGLVQTKLNGTARNPIEDDETGDIAVSSFQCTP